MCWVVDVEAKGESVCVHACARAEEQEGEGDVTQTSDSCCINCMLYRFTEDLH